MEYKDYLASPRWQRLKNTVYNKQKRQCQICGKRYKLEVHHLSYARMGTKEEYKDLVLLCNTHHSLCHWWWFGLYKVPLTKKALLRRYRFVRAMKVGRLRPSHVLEFLFG